MLRTALLFGGRVAAKKSAPKGARGGASLERNSLAKIEQRKFENAAEKLFLRRIQEARARRQRIISAALRRVQLERRRDEPKRVRRYEANKVLAAAELARISAVPENDAAPNAEESEATCAPRPARTRERRGDKLPKKKFTPKEIAARAEAESKAELQFGQLIAEMRERRASAAQTEALQRATRDAETTSHATPSLEAKSDAEVTVSADTSAPTEAVSAETPKRRETRRPKLVRRRASPPIARAEEWNAHEVESQRPAPHPVPTPPPMQTIPLAGFNETPLVPPMRAATTAGQHWRSLAWPASIDAPLVSMAPRAMEMAPPFAHAQTPPAAFPRHASPLAGRQEPPNRGSGLYRL